MTAERERLRDIRERGAPWRKWGPYLRERQWGIGRESEHPDDPEPPDITYEEAASWAYGWGEDGLAGICDEQMRLCFALALWNGRDEALKERLSGATTGGREPADEDLVYIENVPTHSYMRALYKYSGCFDVFVEYAKASPEDILIRITVDNRGTEEARLHVLPQLWFRNTWQGNARATRPVIARVGGTSCSEVLVAMHPTLGRYYWQCEGPRKILFTNNETDTMRFFDRPNLAGCVKNGICEFLVNGKADAVESDTFGTKAAAVYELTVSPNHTQRIRLRLSSADPWVRSLAFARFDSTLQQRRREADEFYASLTEGLRPSSSRTFRRAFATALWNKQVHLYEIRGRLRDRGPRQETQRREATEFQMAASFVISTPEKWESLRLSGWSSTLHSLALARVDPELALAQLALLLDGNQSSASFAALGAEACDASVRAWASLTMYRLQQPNDAERAFIELRHAFNVLSAQEPSTQWSELHALSMFEICFELALIDKHYEHAAIESYFRFFSVLADMSDEICSPATLLCTCAAAVFPNSVAKQLPRFVDHVCSLTCEGAGPFKHFKSLKASVVHGRRVLSIADDCTLRVLLTHLEDKRESPLICEHASGDLPRHVLLLRALVWLHRCFGESLTVDLPSARGKATLMEVATRLARRGPSSLLPLLAARAAPDAANRAASIAHWHDLIKFYEIVYSAAPGAGTGPCWTSLVAPLLCVACGYQIVHRHPSRSRPELRTALRGFSVGSLAATHSGRCALNEERSETGGG
jgi:hypothetical protein